MRLLMEPITYASGSTTRSAISYGSSSQFHVKAYSPSRRPDRLITLMHEELLRNGVDVRIKCNVERIAVDKRRVHGVYVGERYIAARAVVSNSNLKATILQMVGDKHFDLDFIEQARNVRLNNSSCQVYMALKPGEHLDESCGDLLFSSTAPLFRTDLLLGRTSPAARFVYYPKNAANSPFARRFDTNASYTDWALVGRRI
jgi:phytoene dehydrogenase-like protein